MGCSFRVWIISTYVPSIYHFFNIFYIFDFISNGTCLVFIQYWRKTKMYLLFRYFIFLQSSKFRFYVRPRLYRLVGENNLRPLKQMLAYLHHCLTFSKLTFIFIVVAFLLLLLLFSLALLQFSKQNAFICVAQWLFASHAGNRGPIPATKYLPKLLKQEVRFPVPNAWWQMWILWVLEMTL